MKVFADRAAAGRELGAALRSHPLLVNTAEPPIVLAVPRGGLPVGVEVARALGAELDVIVVRKLRAPHNPELAIGAVGEGGHQEIDQDLVARLGISPAQLQAEIDDRRAAVDQRLALYRTVAAPLPVSGRPVVIVDDGVATGSTLRQAAVIVRRQGSAAVVLAVPVGPPSAAPRLAGDADDVLVLSTPAEFLAVGQAYQDFAQLDDAASLDHLRAARS